MRSLTILKLKSSLRSFFFKEWSEVLRLSKVPQNWYFCSYIVVIPMGDSGSHCVANMSGPGGGTGVPQIQSDTLK